MIFDKSKWIWSNSEIYGNQYAEFADRFESDGSYALVRISVSGDYTLYINGQYVDSNQFGDYPHYKVYDEIDITKYITKGTNTIAVLCWYFNKDGMRYNTPEPGAIFEVEQNNKIIVASSEQTPCRISTTYKSGEFRMLTAQLGYSFRYDSTCKDNWFKGEIQGFDNSVLVDKPRNFFERPNLKLLLDNPIKGKVTCIGNKYIVDFGKEIVGLLSIDINSNTVQNINFSYGELLVDGDVKRIIGGRDFSFDYVASIGNNVYTNHMLRLACRYVVVECSEPIVVNNISMIPQYYPTTDAKYDFSNPLDADIYSICLNTLKLCMMEHYVDCPWREQCLYAFDSRNQMLAGYVAFEGGNFEYARANLLLMSKDDRDDGLLSICSPCSRDLTIPAFSLHYIVAVNEYIQHSGDKSLGEEVFAKMESVLHVFANNISEGLVQNFTDPCHWRFYDWAPYGFSQIEDVDDYADFLLNALFVVSTRNFDEICKTLGKENKFSELTDMVAENAAERFYNKENGLYYICDSSERPTELANSLAVLSGIAKGERAESICNALLSDELVPCSLSLKTIKYDALIKADADKYRDAIINEIRDTYKIMVDAGFGTVWETIEGADAFDGAGSLCHGWSAIPIHYYSLFGYLN